MRTSQACSLRLALTGKWLFDGLLQGTQVEPFAPGLQLSGCSLRHRHLLMTMPDGTPAQVATSLRIGLNDQAG